MKKGHENIKNYRVDGTFICAIDGNRKQNKNSTTNHVGVSYHKASSKYRAYINFKNKQYHLGFYDDINDAISARKIAEEKIYGEFLEWYAAEHPEKWLKISSRKK